MATFRAAAAAPEVQRNYAARLRPALARLSPTDVSRLEHQAAMVAAYALLDERRGHAAALAKHREDAKAVAAAGDNAPRTDIVHFLPLVPVGCWLPLSFHSESCIC